MPITINHLPTPISHFTQNNQSLSDPQIVQFDKPINSVRKYGIVFSIGLVFNTPTSQVAGLDFTFTDPYVYYSVDGCVKQRSEYNFDQTCMFSAEQVKELYNSFIDTGTRISVGDVT